MILIVSSIRQCKAGGYLGRFLAAGVQTEETHRVCAQTGFQASCFQPAFLQHYTAGLCKDLLENQLMDSSLIGLARVNLPLAQASWLLLWSHTEDFLCCSCPKGGWLFLDTNLGVGEGQHPCIWSEPSRDPIWLSPPDFPLKGASLGFGICMLEGYDFILFYSLPKIK